jgi:alpha-galactosidase
MRRPTFGLAMAAAACIALSACMPPVDTVEAPDANDARTVAAATAGSPVPARLPDPDNAPPDRTGPVKVYILSGQSNMVGMGDISGGTSRWGSQFLRPVVSVYPGKYSPEADYDSITTIATKALPAFGGVRPTPYPGGGTQVVRGSIRMKASGTYGFNPGYGDSTHNIMEVGGVEVYRKEVGREAVRRTFTFAAGRKYPFRITYLTGNANGLGWLYRTDIPGTLHTLVKMQGKFPHLVDDDGNWTVRSDVTYKGVISAVGQGPLTVGLQGNTIGPELQFGHVMGHCHDEPVLIIKASIGNRSLGWDILPPGSERFTFEGRTYAGYKDTPASWVEGEPKKNVNWYAGKQYDDYTKAVHEVLDNFDTLFPAYKDQGYEVAGFVWWQGHKDGGSAGHISRYEENLVSLIKAWRREFEAPNAPWAIATVGFGGHGMPENYVKILQAQMAVADPKRHPELAGTVTTVDIRGFWRKVEASPRNQGYHYNRNAETYMLVGDALGRGMVRLLGGK